MKKLSLILLLAAAAGICFSQQISFRGETTWHDGNLYRIQVGAYGSQINAERAFASLRNSGFEPQYEDYRHLRRVMINRIGARDIPAVVEKIRGLNFREVWITRENAIIEKWDIGDPGSKYASFEFNGSNNYIVVENSSNPSVHFGDYIMHDRNVIELLKLGLLTIESSADNRINFSFAEEDGKMIRYEGKKADPVSASKQTSLFSSVWKVASVDGIDIEPGWEDDKTVLFSAAGTYLVTDSEGNAEVAQWRWNDADETEFQYSWDRWTEYGVCAVESLSPLELVFLDHTYGGYRKTPRRYRLIPVRQGER